jgi:hypothetical protein
MNETQRKPAARTREKNSAVTPSDEPPTDRRAQRLAAAERSLTEAYAMIRAAGADPDAVTTAFAIAKDCLAEARQCSDRARRELALAQRERSRAQSERLSGIRQSDALLDPVVPDAPGSDMCPKPDEVRTVGELIDALREYWVWSGRPSYRAMERRCGRRFAASTIHTAIHGTKLPSLEMVQAIVIACGGGSDHRQAFQAFTSAWRRLQMGTGADEQRRTASQGGTATRQAVGIRTGVRAGTDTDAVSAPPSRVRPLHSLSESA